MVCLILDVLANMVDTVHWQTVFTDREIYPYAQFIAALIGLFVGMGARAGFIFAFFVLLASSAHWKFGVPSSRHTK
jgi:hypothetical protein